METDTTMFSRRYKRLKNIYSEKVAKTFKVIQPGFSISSDFNVVNLATSQPFILNRLLIHAIINNIDGRLSETFSIAGLIE